MTETEILTRAYALAKWPKKGLLPYSSNHSFLVTSTHNGITLPAVYKPRRGENPLWDFEWGTPLPARDGGLSGEQDVGVGFGAPYRSA